MNGINICPGDTMLRMLQAGLHPDQQITSPRCLRDAIVVSIDVDLGTQGRSETIGIACLDSRLLTDSHVEKSMTTRLLLLRRRSLPANQRVRQYLFGIPEYCPPDAAREAFEKILKPVDLDRGGLRNVLLVGHDVKSDIRFLRDIIGFDVLSIPSVIAVLDTQQLARCVFNFPHKRISLQLTMSALGLKATQLHNSGNDAVYALKAMMYLFCLYQEEFIDQSTLYVNPAQCDREGLAELLWRERLHLLRQAASDCLRPTTVLQAKQATRPPRLPRVYKPDLFEPDITSDGGEVAEELSFVFGTDS